MIGFFVFLAALAMFDRPELWPWMLATFAVWTAGSVGKRWLDHRQDRLLTSMKLNYKQNVLDHEVVTRDMTRPLIERERERKTEKVRADGRTTEQ